MKIELLEAIEQSAEYLNRISKWHTTGKPFGHIYNNPATDYLYEFYCYLTFIQELSEENIIKINVSGGMKNNFPRNPAPKRNGWAKFEAFNDEGEYICDICAGIIINHSQINNFSFGADISVQSPVIEPDEDDVFLIIEAKFKSEGDSIQKNELELLASRKEIFNIPGITNILNLHGSSFEKNSIVTNAQVSNHHAAFTRYKNIRQVGYFYPNSPRIEILD